MKTTPPTTLPMTIVVRSDDSDGGAIAVCVKLGIPVVVLVDEGATVRSVVVRSPVASTTVDVVAHDSPLPPHTPHRSG